MVANGSNNWTSERLENVCTQVTDGKHGDCQDEPNSGFYFLSCKDVSDGKLNYDGARQITEADFLDTHRRTKFEPADILITNSGTIGRMALAPDNELTRRTTFQKSVAILKPVVNRVEPSFLYYALQADIQRLIEFAGGTAQKNLLLRDLRAFEVCIPPLPVQRRIAGILSAYDELIENSQRRIKILEAMARALYREWFVHFRFPGHEDHPRVASPLGEIPQGWEVKTIQDLGKVITGKTPSKANAANFGEDVQFLKTPDMHGNMFILNTNERLSASGAASQANKTLPAGSICVSCIGTIGVVSITTEECQTNQQINSVVLANPASREFLFLRFQDAKQTLENLGSNGATMGNVNKGKFEAMEIVSPPIDLLTRYHQIAQPMFMQILALARQIQNLRRTRDLLLPRLLSGQIDVAALEP